MKYLGFDPSLTAFGWALVDLEVPSGTVGRYLESGRFKTSAKTLFVERYMEQREQVTQLIRRLREVHGEIRIGCESPVFHEMYSEGLYGLYLYNCEAMRTAQADVVFFSPGQLKARAARVLDRPKGWKMGKPDMVAAVKRDAGMAKGINHNEADAYWAAVAGGRFWSFLDGTLAREDLTPLEVQQFTDIHTYRRGKRAGTTVERGILFKEDARFFRWSQPEVETAQKRVRAKRL